MQVMTGNSSPGKTSRVLEVSAKRLTIRAYQGWELNSDRAMGLSGNRPKSSGFSPKSLPSKQRKFSHLPKVIRQASACERRDW